MGELDDLWADDLLRRREEAELLEQVLTIEADECARNGAGQAFVLALDAAYGEGKTYFLSKFRQHLERSHPVAFIDAWVDDANDEPLLAIMSAINEALSPFLSRSTGTKKWLQGATRAAFPIIARVAVGAGSAFAKRNFGEDAASDVARLLAESAIDSGAEALTSLVDQVGEEMMAAYRARQASRTLFKSNMRALIQSINEEAVGISGPLYVIVDELDRCRPNFALKVLEEIKHLFEVQGVVFVIAMHGDQLEKSVAAVYGEDFDSRSYLQRFFTRRYKLRRLSLRELASTRIAEDCLEQVDWNIPSLVGPGGAPGEKSLSACIAAFCEDFAVTPRQLHSIMDGLRLLAKTWTEQVPIELIYVLGLLLESIRANDAAIETDHVHSTDLHFGWDPDGQRRGGTILQLFKGYQSISNMSLNELATANYRFTHTSFVVDAIEAEAKTLHLGRPPAGSRSLLSTYRERVQRFGRLLAADDRGKRD